MTRPGTALDWDAAVPPSALQALRAYVPGLSFEAVASTGSTNTTLLERARADAAARPCLLVAEHQTAGRGRLGRRWVGHPGASLMFSLSLPLSPASWAGLSLAVGLALADALDPESAGTPEVPAAPEGAAGVGAAPRVLLKWPNDLWLADGPGRGRKLGGILIETVGLGDQRLCVVGVGINVAPQAVQEAAYGYACLQEIESGASAPAALACAALPLVRALRRFECEGFAPLQARYARRDLLKGHVVDTTLPTVPFGTAEGVDLQGALQVRHEGRVHAVLSGEVSVRLRARAA